MAQSFLIFDFGADEVTAQQARHRLEGWKQAFRLDKKLLLKFDRKEEEEAEPASAAKSAQQTATGSTKSKGASKGENKASAKSEEKESEEPAASADIRLLVRLDFSDHEKLSHQRWLDRIPSEEPFKAAKATIVRSGDPEHSSTAERFDSLD
jgi:hypothetical protein